MVATLITTVLHTQCTVVLPKQLTTLSLEAFSIPVLYCHSFFIGLLFTVIDACLYFCARSASLVACHCTYVQLVIVVCVNAVVSMKLCYFWIAKVESHSGYKKCVYILIYIHACIMCWHAAIVFDLNIIEFSACVFLCVFLCKPCHR